MKTFIRPSLFAKLGALALLFASAALPALAEAPAALRARQERIQKTAREVAPAVVAIVPDYAASEKNGRNRPDGSGSGVIVSEDGLILTAAHVTDAITDNGRRKEVSIIFPDGTRAQVTRVDYAPLDPR